MAPTSGSCWLGDFTLNPALRMPQLSTHGPSLVTAHGANTMFLSYGWGRCVKLRSCVLQTYEAVRQGSGLSGFRAEALKTEALGFPGLGLQALPKP